MGTAEGDDAVRETFGEFTEAGAAPLGPTDVLTAFADVMP
jgi:hypothetical protein